MNDKRTNIKRILEVAQGITPKTAKYRLFQFVDGKPQIVEEHKIPFADNDLNICIVTTREESEYIDRLNKENECDE